MEQDNSEIEIHIGPIFYGYCQCQDVNCHDVVTDMDLKELLIVKFSLI